MIKSVGNLFRGIYKTIFDPVVFSLLFFWTVSCWFATNYTNSLFGVPLFAIDVWIPFTVSIVWLSGFIVGWIVRSGKNFLSAAIDWSVGNKKTVICLMLIVIFAMALQIPAIQWVWAANDSDSAIFGIESYHIAEGTARPMWFYGKHFNGSYIPHVAALFNVVFGKSPANLHLVNSLHFAGFLVFLFFIVRKIAGDTPALLVMALAAIPTFDIYDFINNTYFAPVMFWGSMSLLLLLNLLEKEKPSWRLFYWYGFVTGFGFWVHLQILFFFGTGLVILFLKKKTFHFPASIAVIPGILVGSVVTVIDSYFHNFIIFKFFFGQAANPVGLVQRFSDGTVEFIRHLIRILGFGPGFSWELFIALTIVFAALLFYLVTKNWRVIRNAFLFRNTDSEALLFVIFMFVVLFVFAPSSQATPPSPSRYVAPIWFSIPAIIVLAAWQINKKLHWLRYAVIGIFALIFISSYSNVLFRFYNAEQRGREWHNTAKELGITRFYGGFWSSYRSSFCTGEQIIGSALATFFELHKPYYYKVRAHKDPAYFFIIPNENKAARLYRGRLDAVGIKYQERRFTKGLFLHSLSEPVHCVNIRRLKTTKYSGQVKLSSIEKIKGIKEAQGLYRVQLKITNSGKTLLKQNGSNGHAELIVGDDADRVIRKLALDRNLAPGQSLKMELIIDRNEIKNRKLFAYLAISGININKKKLPLSLKLETSKRLVANKIDVTRKKETPILSDDFNSVFAQGWNFTENKNKDIHRCTAGETAELKFVLKKARRMRFKASGRTFLNKDGVPQRVRLTLEINGTKYKTFALQRRFDLDIKIKPKLLIAGLNTITFTLNNCQSEYDRVKGLAVLRYVRKGLVLDDMTFKKVGKGKKKNERKTSAPNG